MKILYKILLYIRKISLSVTGKRSGTRENSNKSKCTFCKGETLYLQNERKILQMKKRIENIIDKEWKKKIKGSSKVTDTFQFFFQFLFLNSIYLVIEKSGKCK